MTERPDTAPCAKKPPQWQPIEMIEIVAWRGELAALCSLLRISKSDFEIGLKNKTGVRRQGALTSVRVELRNRAPLFAALQRKLSEGASE